jgi:chitodextrinase
MPKINKNKPKARKTSMKSSKNVKLPSNFWSKFKNPKPIVFSLVIGVIGTVLLFQSFAATPPTTGGYFSTLTPGSALPSDATCAAQVHHSAWEPRPENNTANQTVPTGVSIPGYTMANGGVDDRSRTLADRVTGNFRGTTDEIIQWASCKWGFNDDIVRATAAHESWWKQAALGDIISDQSKCQVGYTAPCPQSFGLLQDKATVHPGTFPGSRDSTAFSVDYALMYRRVCFEGYTTWLKSSYPTYAAGDEWGCVGQWNSGGWYDAAAQNYITNVKNYYSTKPWLSWPDQAITDTTAPTTPAGLTASATSTSQIQLNWTASIDNVGVSSYDIYRNNAFLTNVAGVGYSDAGLTANTTYSYYVVARDSAGNTSAASNVVNAATQSVQPPAATDTITPVVTINSPPNGVTVIKNVNITGTASDNVGVARMEIWVDNNRKATSSTSNISFTWSAKGAARGKHTITIKAFDAAGNVGQSSITVNK